MLKLSVIYLGNSPLLKWQPYPDSVKYFVYRGLTKEKLAKIGESHILQYADLSDEANIVKKDDKAKFYYQIYSINEQGESTPFTEVETLNTDDMSYPFLGIYKTQVKRNEFTLKSISGEEVTLYVKKGAGEKCPDCYNEITGDTYTEKSLCPICYGTTYVGGFEKFSDILIRILNAPDQIIETPFGITVGSTKSGRMSVYPLVNNGDWFRTKGGDIYMIGNVEHEKVKNFILKQKLDLKLLSTGHVYYTINL